MKTQVLQNPDPEGRATAHGYVHGGHPLRRPQLRRSRRMGEAAMGHGGVLDGKAVFLSDVHLVDPRDAQTQLFLNFVRNINRESAEAPLASGVRHVFLIGDIFEFIDASSRYFRKLWKEVFDALEELRTRGVHVYFVEGNHDFGFEHVRQREGSQRQSPKDGRWLDQWATFGGDAGLEFEHPALGLVHIRHGDDVVAPPEYLYFRSFVKSAFAGFLLRQIPASLSHSFFLWLAEQSRKRGSSYTLTFEKVHRDVSGFLSSGHFRRPRLLIMGHIHVYIDAMIGDMRMLTGPDWYQAPSYLVLTEEGEVQRIFLDDARRVDLLQSVASDLPPKVSPA